ncbi:alpha/beta hydrolase fold domain-containing protein [Nonomuraea sp. NPDC049152]|uniref:alpha/beta hydrolase n=1 Tax=Nonomuraea sp. NPDC049152 TaxID=3154350 RepID=UPI0033F5BAC2
MAPAGSSAAPTPTTASCASSPSGPALSGLPPAMVLNGEADVLRDEGEAYANKLREAGVEVTAIRCQGVVHDFVMVDLLRDTHAGKAALEISTAFIRRLLGTD